MHAIEESLRRINGEPVDTYRRVVVENNTVMIVEAGTTGYKGSRRDDGGRSILSVTCSRGDFHFEALTDENGDTVGFEVACCGDDALNALMKVLRFAHEVLDDQRRGIDG